MKDENTILERRLFISRVFKPRIFEFFFLMFYASSIRGKEAINLAFRLSKINVIGYNFFRLG